ncbi:MAG: response regulator [Bryobacteraceae bacterium]
MPDTHANPTVLIVTPFGEDYEVLRRILDASTECQWRVRFAATCQEAWLALHQEEVDAVIAECDFPDGLSWKELLEEIQNMGGFPPLIVASRVADERLWAEVLNLGVYDLLVKPFDGEETLRVLAMAMRQARQARYACDALSSAMV